MRALPRLDVPRLLASARRFAEAHLTLASALREPPRDPWVERILDGVGHLAGATWIHMERRQGALFHTVAETLAPEIVRPTPSLCLVEADPGPVREVAAGTEMTTAGDGPTCRFRIVEGGCVGGWSVVGARVSHEAGVAALELDLSGAPASGANAAFTLHLPTDTRDGLTLLHWLGHRCERMEAVVGGQRITLPPPERLGLGADDPAAPRGDDPPSVHAALRWYAVARERFSLVRTAKVWLPEQVRSVRLRFVLQTPPPLAAVPEVRLDRLLAVNLHDAPSEPMAFDVSRGSAPLRVAGSRRGGAYAVGIVRAGRRGLAESLIVAPARRLGATPTDPREPLRYQSSLEDDGDDDVRLHVHVATDRDLVVRADLVAHDGPPAGGLAPGALRGVGLRSVRRSSPYVPPPSGAALARRVLTLAAIPLGTQDARNRLVEHALLANVPSALGRELHDAFEARARAVQTVEVRPAKRRSGAGVERGCEVRATVDGTPFLGEGDVGLFGAALFASLRHAAATNAFIRLSLSCPRLSFDERWESP